MDGVLVSLQVDPAWDAPWVHAERELLPEDPDELDLVKQNVEVRHVSSLDHVEEHADWIEQAGISDFKHGSDIWEARADLYPHLSFLPRTEQHFAGLRRDWVIPAARELLRINGAFAEWDPTLAKEPHWRSDVTPESKSRIRKRLFEFEDLDGVVRCFELHGRFARATAASTSGSCMRSGREGSLTSATTFSGRSASLPSMRPGRPTAHLGLAPSPVGMA